MFIEILQNSLSFFIQTFIIVVAIIAIILTIAALVMRKKLDQQSLEIENLNQKHEQQVRSLEDEILEESALKTLRKERKKKDKEDLAKKPKVFVLEFLNGDIKASPTDHLRDEISTVLGVARPTDEIIIKLESPGGLVHNYGLAAAQLQRIRDAKIPLTICVDKVAASGGYLMACVGDKILASPFALIGSIGVVAQVPNFNRLLKKHDVDYKEYTAGEYKRTVSLFGEITDKGEEKFKQQLELTHKLFKSYVERFRPQLNINEIATGEFWYGETALNLKLVDEIRTSDEYILTKLKEHQVIRLSYAKKPKFSDKISGFFTKILETVLERFLEKNSNATKV